MQRKIALEEHVGVPETLADSAIFVPADHWQELQARLLDIHERRLRLMDAHGIEMTVLSLNAPTVQAIPEAERAEELARRTNDFLAEQVARRPQRFQAFGALPLQDPERASGELRRCMLDLGFRGVLVNGFSDAMVQGNRVPLYYDMSQYEPFWAEPNAVTRRSIYIRATR